MRKSTAITAFLAITMLSGCVAVGSQTTEKKEVEESAWDCESRISDNVHVCGTQSDPVDRARITLVVSCSGGGLVSFLRVTDGNRTVWHWPEGASSVIARFDGRAPELFNRQDIAIFGRGAFRIWNDDSPDQIERFRASETVFITMRNREGKTFEGTLALREMEEKLEYLSFMGGCPL